MGTGTTAALVRRARRMLLEHAIDESLVFSAQLGVEGGERADRRQQFPLTLSSFVFVREFL